MTRQQVIGLVLGVAGIGLLLHGAWPAFSQLPDVGAATKAYDIVAASAGRGLECLAGMFVGSAGAYVAYRAKNL